MPWWTWFLIGAGIGMLMYLLGWHLAGGRATAGPDRADLVEGLVGMGAIGALSYGTLLWLVLGVWLHV